MTSFEIYSLILCIIVFALLTGLGIFTITVIYKLTVRLIRCGEQDKAIIKEFSDQKKKSRLSRAIDSIILLVLCLFIGLMFGSSLYINCTQNTYFEDVPTYRVVKTNSMSEKNKKNTYLFDNNLNDQIQTFDLIAMYKLPAEKDLKLYDIVIYEVDGLLIVHRIVGIEEPNEQHPNERHFKLQGDAVDAPDRFPVLYSQMRGIYRGEKVPFVGSFVLFMQSPAGWLCIMLVAGAIIASPILDKKLLNARKTRYALIAINKQTIDDEISVSDSSDADSRFSNYGPTKTFYQRLDEASEHMKNRYNAVKGTLDRIEGIRVIEGKTQHSYKSKSICIARLLFKGKTLNVCLGASPNEYQDSKYIFTDLSEKTKYKNYPMCLKLSSERQTRWACDLILELANKKGLKILENPVQIISKETPFESFNKNMIVKTFEEKLAINAVAGERFKDISSLLNNIDNVRVIESKKARTYKCGSKAIAKFSIKGKTLNTYTALQPKEYENSKYIFTDESSIKSYANYPMRVKITSERQTRWAKELLIQKINKEGLTLKEEINKTIFSFNNLKKKKVKTFKQKLKLYAVAKERYLEIKKYLESLENVRVIEGKQTTAYKIKGLAVVKFNIKGKTLNAYLGLNPSEYENTKYIFTDVSGVKKYANYPMRVKVSSDRQVKWVKELIQQILQK